MTTIFSVEMFPAREGDCLWISYGDPDDPSHVLVDGGRKATARDVRAKIESLPAERRRFELVVVTHVDRDHIEGMLDILENGLWGASVGDIWFNGYRHLERGLERFGAVQGERLTASILNGLPWNEAFGGGAASIPLGAPAALPPLPGGMRMTLLSPTPEKLESLRPVWIRECEKAGIVPGAEPEPEPLPAGLESMGGLDIERLAETPCDPDRAPANGSSIALLAEYDGRSILLGADAHPEVLEASLRALAGEGRLRLDAFKVPHHASGHNVSRQLLELIDCDRFLISTNGSYFDHPEPAAIAKIIRYGGDSPELIFNYRSPETERWDDVRLQERHNYSVRFPAEDRDGHQSVSL